MALPEDGNLHELVRGIDVCYLSPEQVAAYVATGDDQYFPGVAALVAEVISPSETAGFINQKTADYLAGGASLVWLLFPKTRTVRVYLPAGEGQTLSADATLDGGAVLPGFAVGLGALFS